MLAEALAALASTGATALVTAMVTDGWEGARTRFARLLGRGDVKQAAAAAQLEQSKAMLVAASGAELEGVRADQEAVWRARLEQLLERDPLAEEELQVFIADVQAHTVASAGQVEQQAIAFGQAQQAVVGHGVQNVSFGGQHESRQR